MSLMNKLTKSREVILSIVEKRGFNVDKYKNFTTAEIDTMLSGTASKNVSNIAPLDIIFEGDNKLIVKFIINQKLRVTNLQNLIEDIISNNFPPEQRKEGDTLILITNDKINNSSFDEFLETQYQKNKIFVQVFWIETIMRDITKHILVPQHNIISEEEKEDLLTRYNITSYTQLPIILKNDPVAKFYGAKRGDVFKVTRASETAGEYISYRYVQ